jgi:hypothetical protein
LDRNEPKPPVLPSKASASSNSLPEVHAFGRDLLRWYGQSLRPRLRQSFRKESRRILSLRSEDALKGGQPVKIEVTPTTLVLSGQELRDTEKQGMKRLAKRFGEIGVHSLTLQPGLEGDELVDFLEACLLDTSGGQNTALSSPPEHIELDWTPPPKSAPRKLEPSEEAALEEEADPPATAADSTPEEVQPAEARCPETMMEVSAICDQLLLAHPQDEEIFHQVVDLYAVMLSEARGDEAKSLLEEVLDTGETLIRDGHLRTWLGFLRYLRDAVPKLHSMNALQFSLQLLSEVSRHSRVSMLFLQLAKERTGQLECLRDVFRVLPASAVERVVRAALYCPAIDFEPDSCERGLLVDYLVGSADNVEGLCKVVSFPDANLARLAIEALPSMGASVGSAIVRAGLGHASVEVRTEAVRAAQCLPASEQAQCLQAASALAKCCVPRAIRPLIVEVGKAGFQNRSVKEQVAFYRALAETKQVEALYVVEKRVVRQRSSLREWLSRGLRRQADDPVRTALLEELVEIDILQVQEIVRRAR